MSSSHSLSGVYRAVFLSVLFTLLSACGGGGGDDDSPAPGPGTDPAPTPTPTPTPTLNLSATSLNINSAEPRIGYPISGTVGYSSDARVDNVELSLFIIEKKDDPEAESRQYPLGNQVFSGGSVGSGTIDFDVNIPSSVDTAGQYFITAIVDGADEILETDEEDNTASVEVTLAEPGNPNLFVTDFELDRRSMEISTASYDEQVELLEGNVYNADAAATLTVGVDGIRLNNSIKVEAFARLQMRRDDVGTTHDVPLYLWNTEAGRYINAYGVDPSGTVSDTLVEWLPLGEFGPQLATTVGDQTTLEDVARNSTHINFYFPGLLGRELEYQMRYGHLPTTLSSDVATRPPPDLTAQSISELKGFLRNLPSNGITGDESDAMAVMEFAICVQIRAVDQTITEDSGVDNEVCSPLNITLPPVKPPYPQPAELGGYETQFIRPALPLENSTDFSTRAGGKVFSFGLEFGSSVSADNRGYKERMYGGVPLKIFGIDYDFMKIDVSAQLVPEYAEKPDGEESGFRIEIKHAGQVLASIVELPSDVQITLEIDKLSFSKELPDPNKNGIIESTFFVGPIPLSAGAYAAGNLGVGYQPFVFTTGHPEDYRLGVQGGPYANLEATMYAALGSRRLPVSAGVEGVLSLLDERIEFFNGVEIDVIEPRGATDPAEFIITQGPKITNIFTGPRGKINLFVRYVVPKVKKCKVGLIKIPCPKLVKMKATKNIYTSPALFQLTDVLYENPNLRLDVVVPATGEPLYFQP